MVATDRGLKNIACSVHSNKAVTIASIYAVRFLRMLAQVEIAAEQVSKSRNAHEFRRNFYGKNSKTRKRVIAVSCYALRHLSRSPL